MTSMAVVLAGCAISSKAEEPSREITPAAEMIPRAVLDAYVQRRWERRIDQWRTNPPAPGGTLFLGSSIIEEGPWADLFPNRKVINRGIGADTTKGVLLRLDDVIAIKPDQIFLYIGGNDFSRLANDPETAIDRLSQVVRRLRIALPETEIFVSTLLAREIKFAKNIREFNSLLKSKRWDNGVTIVDSYPLFARSDGSMDPKYSNDNIHLNGKAYRQWAKLIAQKLEAK